jgi:outer membrane scaffolding protein for murein synthesis (MipA/OmpV family)
LAALLAAGAGSLVALPVSAEVRADAPLGEESATGDAPAPSPSASSAGPELRFFSPQANTSWYAGLINIVAARPHEDAPIRWLPLPVLTRLDDYTFTDQVWVARESTGFLRFLQAPAWEVMLAGTIDTAGYEPGDSAALSGMASRRWTLNAGLGAAWRGERFFAEAVGVTDVLGRHDGQSYVASVGMPLRLFGDHMQLVPHVDLVHRSAAYVDYYYGVRAAEARPDRPVYSGAAATGMRLAARGSWRFGDRWALSGRLAVELLGRQIADSPIVDRGTSWTLTFSVLHGLGGGRDAGSARQPTTPAFDSLQAPP